MIVRKTFFRAVALGARVSSGRKDPTERESALDGGWDACRLVRSRERPDTLRSKRLMKGRKRGERWHTDESRELLNYCTPF